MQLLANDLVRQRVRYTMQSHTVFRVGRGAGPLELQDWLALPPTFNPRTAEFAAELNAQSPQGLKRIPLTSHEEEHGGRALGRAQLQIRALLGVDPLPDFPLDGKVSAINAATKGLMKAALTRRGLDADSIVDAKDGYREVIRGIGQHFNPQFSEDRFHVVDV